MAFMTAAILMASIAQERKGECVEDQGYPALKLLLECANDECRWRYVDKIKEKPQKRVVQVKAPDPVIQGGPPKLSLMTNW